MADSTTSAPGGAHQPPEQRSATHEAVETSVKKLAAQSNSPKSPSVEQNSFLGQKTNDSDTGQQGSEATVISYPSASTKQVTIYRQLAQSHKDPPKGKQITSLDELPPVVLKDPIDLLNTAIDPRSVVDPPVKGKAEVKLPGSFTNTSTITTTGYDHLQNRPAQFDGRDGMSEARVKHSSYNACRAGNPYEQAPSRTTDRRLCRAPYPMLIQ